MKITIHGVDYILEPCERGTWKVNYDEYTGWAPNRECPVKGVVAELEGWGGEVLLTVFSSGMQCGLTEFLVIEQRVDSPIVWHRISEASGFDMEAEMALKIQMQNLLNLLMADPLYGEDGTSKADLTCWPGFQQVTKSRVKASQRMNKDMKEAPGIEAQRKAQRGTRFKILG